MFTSTRSRLIMLAGSSALTWGLYYHGAREESRISQTRKEVAIETRKNEILTAMRDEKLGKPRSSEDGKDGGLPEFHWGRIPPWPGT